MKLYTKIFLGLILGIIFGLVVASFAESHPAFLAIVKEVLDPVGNSFIRLIKMVIVPLVFASLTMGVASLGGDMAKIGRLGIKSVAFFVITTILATGVGIGVANYFEPGKGINKATMEKIKGAGADKVLADLEKNDLTKKAPGLKSILMNIIPSNPVKSLAKGDMLQIIFFAMFFGLAITALPEKKRKPLLTFVDSVNSAMINAVQMVMKLAPYGVFALIAMVVLKFGNNVLYLLARYTVVVFIGQFILFMVIDCGAVYLFTRMSPFKFLKAIKDVLLVSLSTSSSLATLPVSMEACEKNLGVSNQVTSFVTPLGATINMNGTALYQGVTAVFIAQVYGVDLTMAQQLTVVATATLASVGTAGVPGIGMITLAMVLRTINIPMEGIALVIGIDRILDTVRTVVNVTGDCACAYIVAHSEGEIKTVQGV